MASATGIEISGGVLRCVVLDGSAKAPRLRTAFSAPLESEQQGEETPVDIAAQAEKLLKENGLPVGSIAVAIDGQHVFSREVVVPFTRGDQIRKTVKFEAEEFMPAAPVESMVVDYYKVTEIDGKSRILVAGVQKQIIADALDLCKKADFNPRLLDLDSACLANTGFAAGVFQPPQTGKNEQDEEETVHTVAVALDVSEEVARLVLVEDDMLRRARTFKVSLPGGKPTAETVSKLKREIRRTEASCSVCESVSIVYLTGPAFSHELASTLGGSLGVKVQMLPLEAFTGAENAEKLQQLKSAGSVALGAALKALGSDRIGYNFRKEEYAYRKAFDELKVGLSCTVCLAFFIAFMLAYSFNVRLSQHRYAIETLRGDAKNTFVKLLAGEPLRNYETSKISNEFKTALKKRESGTITKAPRIYSALDMLKDFSNAVSGASLKKDAPALQIQEFRVSQETLTFKGIVDSRDQSYRILSEVLRKVPYLTQKTNDVSGKDDELVASHTYKVETERMERR